MSQRRSRSFPFGVVLAGAAGAVVVLGGFFVVRARSADSVAPSPSGSPSSVAALEALIAAPTTPGAPGASDDPGQPRGQILSKKSLPEAISVARPLMANTVGRVDVGSALLSLWASRSLTWEALEAIPETSPALFRKDPDAERGKRLCLSGTILQIRAEKTLAARVVEDRTLPLVQRQSSGLSPSGLSPSAEQMLPPSTDPSATATAPELLAPTMDLSVPGDGKVYVATIQTKSEPSPDAPHGARATYQKDLLVAEIIAVKSSGTLVDGSEARACGILTGVTLPAGEPGSLSSDVTEHRIVGMFDLPENHGG